MDRVNCCLYVFAITFIPVVFGATMFIFGLMVEGSKKWEANDMAVLENTSDSEEAAGLNDEVTQWHYDAYSLTINDIVQFAKNERCECTRTCRGWNIKWLIYDLKNSTNGSHSCHKVHDFEVYQDWNPCNTPALSKLSRVQFIKIYSETNGITPELVVAHINLTKNRLEEKKKKLEELDKKESEVVDEKEEPKKDKENGSKQTAKPI